MAGTLPAYGAAAALAFAAWLCAADHALAGEDLTLKERLSDKASDEQRVDNCRVAMERRGLRPRPGCADANAAATAAPKVPETPAVAKAPAK
jgi:hypothetical protein